MKLKSNNTKSVNENLKRSSSELEVIKFKTFREKSIKSNLNGGLLAGCNSTEARKN